MAGTRRDDRPGDAQLAGEQGGVQRPVAAVGDEDEVARVETSAQCDEPERVAHLRDRIPQHAARDGTSIPVGRLPLPFMHAMGDKAQLIEVSVAAALCAVVVGLIRAPRLRPPTGGHERLPAALATVGLSSVRGKVLVFSLSAGMAGLGGVCYAGQQGGIGANDVQFISSLTLLLFVCIWGIRTISGALLGGLTQAALPVLQVHLPASLADITGLAAGIGIILLARDPEGILGMEWLTRRVSLPFGDATAGTDELVLAQDGARAA